MTAPESDIDTPIPYRASGVMSVCAEYVASHPSGWRRSVVAAGIVSALESAPMLAAPVGAVLTSDGRVCAERTEEGWVVE